MYINNFVELFVVEIFVKLFKWYLNWYLFGVNNDVFFKLLY